MNRDTDKLLKAWKRIKIFTVIWWLVVLPLSAIYGNANGFGIVVVLFYIFYFVVAMPVMESVKKQAK